jgi:outer membrane protein assembly factor BamA
VLSSDKGREKHGLGIDIPHAFDGEFRVRGGVRYDRDIGFLYYGIGNNTPYDPAATPDNPLYQNVRAGPSFNLELLRYVGGNVRLGPILGLKWTDVSSPSTSLLEQQKPLGIQGGRTHYLGLALIYDTRDFEPYPTKGDVHELYFYVYNHWLTSSNYDFLRFTYTYLRFIELHKRLILAHRTLFETMTGNVPYFELGGVGGSNPAIGFGGDRYLRGYDSDRFIDKIKFVMGFELRWDPVTFVFARQEISLGVVPFVDFGRVWPKLWPIDLGAFHASMGYGLRMIWNSRFIIRADYAINSEGTSVIVNLGSSF